MLYEVVCVLVVVVVKCELVFVDVYFEGRVFIFGEVWLVFDVYLYVMD